MAQEIVYVGTTKRFRLTATRDGSTWDLTSATVKLLLEDPSGTVTEYAATVSNPTAGVAEYTNLAALFTTSNDGAWEKAWKITDGGTVEIKKGLPFTVSALI
jgi:hypothetical protein